MRNPGFPQATGFLQLAPGNDSVTVGPAGSKTVAIGPANITVNAGGIYTAVVRNPA